MLRGLTTVTLVADDLPAAQARYTELLGVNAYFAREVNGVPAYVEFRIVDGRYAPADRSGAASGAMTYWAVDDLETTLARLVSLGATVHQEITSTAPGYVTASVTDPFGNILGVMHNEHYLKTAGER